MKKSYIAALASALTLVSAGATGSAFRSGDSMPRPVVGVQPFIVHTPAQVNTDMATALPSHAPARAKAKDVPFIEDFTTADNLDDWYVQDVNQDGDTWEYKESFGLLRCYSFGTNDDWVITPAINLGKDDVYTLTFSYGSQGSRYNPEHLTVTMGTSEYGTRHTTVLYEDAEILNFWNGSMKTVTLTIPVPDDAAYYFGFHSTSSNGYCLYLDDIKVEQNGTMAAPEAVSDFVVTAGAQGALEATVSFTAPTKAADGSDLSTISSILVFRDDMPQAVKTFEAPAPGSNLSFTDTGLSTGMHTWTAVPTLSGEEGARSQVEAYVGVDTPKAVTEAKATETADGSVKITWQLPEGVNGGYVGEENLSYTIVRNNGADGTVLTYSAQGTSYEDNTLDTDVQNYYYYTIIPATVTGAGTETETNSLFTGSAYPIPFKENFAYGRLKNNPWVVEAVVNGIINPQWAIVPQGTYPLCPTIDGDDGMLAFNTLLGGFNFGQGAQIRIATPVMDFSNATEPYMSFYLFHYDTTQISQEYDSENDEYVTVTYTYSDCIKVQVSVENGEYVDVDNATIELAANNGGWTEYRVSLAPYKGNKKVSVGLLGVADGGGNIHIDNLKISDTYAADLELTDILGPQSVKIGSTAKYQVHVVNNGTASTKNYTVSLCVDGEPVQTLNNPGAAIFANGGEKVFNFTFTPDMLYSGAVHEVTARINFADDQCPANNESETIQLEVPAVALPAVDALNGSVQDNSVTLEWDEPDFAAFRSARSDDMEQLTPFAISNIADYTLIDNDKSATYCISGITSYANCQAAMAWQVFNPDKAGVDLTEPFNRRWYAHSGEQFLISWGASNADSNDDWLISPELSGEEQVVSFYIKSVTMAYTERFRVLYSMDSKSVSDFVKVAEANYYTPGGQWRKFSVRLPQGAKYFAIHCISADAFGIMVDDMTFVPKNGASVGFDLAGFNVYRDGVKLNAEPIGETSYTDTNVPDGGHTYAVTTVYTNGESSPSQKFSTSMSGVDNVLADSPVASFSAVGHKGCLEIISAEDMVNVTVYSIDGRAVAAENVAGSHTITVPAGVYVVTDGRTVVKTVVK